MDLSGGKAWVYRVPGNATLTKPVIIADGFSAGSTLLREWDGLWGRVGAPDHPWGSQLHERGRDVIVLLGYDSRNAPIRDNAEVATSASAGPSPSEPAIRRWSSAD